MKRFGRPAALALLLVTAYAAPARADDAANLQSKLDDALKDAKSFVVTTSYPAQAYAATIVYVAPDRTRVAVALAANTTDVVTIGHTVYSSKNGAPFERSTQTPGPDPKPPIVGSVKVSAPHADVHAGGTTYGAFEASVPLGKLVTLTCTYDKKNYRLVRCANDEVTQTYARYDDPQNVVEAPPNAVDAPQPVPTKEFL